MHTGSTPVSRRAMLKSVGALGVALSAPAPVWSGARARPGWQGAVLDYLRSLARPDGGYGWADQDESDLTVTWAVLGCFDQLGFRAERPETLAGFVRTHHPQRGRKPEYELHQFDYAQIQALLWLGQDVSPFRAKVLGWTAPTEYLRRYERDGNPVLGQEVTAILGRKLLGLSMADAAPAFARYLEARRRGNGSFNHTPAGDGSDGHVVVTWWALQTWAALGRALDQVAETVGWLRACQLENGGFTYQPKPELAGTDDVAYVWAASNGLKLFNAQPARADDCARYIGSLRNGDGGFGDRPGWASSPVATYYAVSALAALGRLESGPIGFSRASSAGADREVAESRAPRVNAFPAGLKVWSLQLEAPGRGSPSEAVDLARALGIHLWGAKNAPAGWVARAQAIADARGAQVKFFAANEEYGTYVRVPGLGTYSHISDLCAPAGAKVGPDLAKRSPLSWDEFRAEKILPLEQARGRVFWQFGENEEFARVLLDDSVARGAYAAISTFHFGNPDFLLSQPFLYRYRQWLPLVALQDAHAAESWWWSDQLSGFRTVFLAEAPSWEGWLEALKNNRVMAIRHDAVTEFKTRLHGGAPGVREFVLARRSDWEWWGESARYRRPLVAMAVVKPEDEFEAGRSRQGLKLRVRCAWQNTLQGLPKQPLAKLVALTVDGKALLEGEALASRAIRVTDAKGRLADHYYLCSLDELRPGQHRATARVERLGDGEEFSSTIDFEL